jgi:hypothetical protein
VKCDCVDFHQYLIMKFLLNLCPMNMILSQTYLSFFIWLLKLSLDKLLHIFKAWVCLSVIKLSLTFQPEFLPLPGIGPYATRRTAFSPFHYQPKWSHTRSHFYFLWLNQGPFKDWLLLPSGGYKLIVWYLKCTRIRESLHNKWRNVWLIETFVERHRSQV